MTELPVFILKFHSICVLVCVCGGGGGLFCEQLAALIFTRHNSYQGLWATYGSYCRPIVILNSHKMIKDAFVLQGDAFSSKPDSVWTTIMGLRDGNLFCNICTDGWMSGNRAVIFDMCHNAFSVNNTGNSKTRWQNISLSKQYEFKFFLLQDYVTFSSEEYFKGDHIKVTNHIKITNA